MALFEQIGIYAFLLLLVVAGANDVMSQRIPNWIVIALTVSFLAFAGITRMPVVTMGMHLVVGLMLLCVGYGLFALRVIGGGRRKAFGFCGAVARLSGGAVVSSLYRSRGWRIGSGDRPLERHSI